MWIRRVPAAVFVLAYLVALGVGTYSQILGDARLPAAAGYYVTWDMFPGHRGTSERVLVVGETEEGEHVLLYPSPRQRWRGGLHGDLTRLDFAGAPLTGASAEWLDEEVALSVAAHDEAWPDDPVRHVDVVREFWPSRTNLTEASRSDDLALTGDADAPARSREIVLSVHADEFRSQPGDVAGQGSAE